MATTLYVKRDCPHCASQRQKLDRAQARYVVVDVDESPHCVPELLKLTGRRRIVPVLVEGTKVSIAPEGGTEF